MIRIELPTHLSAMARAPSAIIIEAGENPTQNTVIDALEESYPALRGTIRDYATGRRRPLVRFFACGEDVSHEPPDAPLPAGVAGGGEPFLIVAAIAGG